eukprot:8252836-Pyramimonas_sp.AAC.1
MAPERPGIASAPAPRSSSPPSARRGSDGPTASSWGAFAPSLPSRCVTSWREGPTCGCFSSTEGRPAKAPRHVPSWSGALPVSPHCRGMRALSLRRCPSRRTSAPWARRAAATSPGCWGQCRSSSAPAAAVRSGGRGCTGSTSRWARRPQR